MAAKLVWGFFFVFHQMSPASSSSLYSEKSPSVNLNQLHLVVGASSSPIVKRDNISLVSVGIFDGIILDILSQSLNFTYDVLAPTDDLSPGSLLPNGSWTGTIGQIQRKEVDVSVSSTPPISEKLSFSDVSIPLSFVESAIVVPFPREETKFWIDSSVFTRQAWIALVGSLVAMVVSVWIINKLTTNYPNRSQNTFSYWILHFTSFLTSQGNTLQNPSISFRMAILTSVFAIYVISNYFTASYTSFLSIPDFKVRVNSIEDLANNKDFKTLLIKGSGTDQYIMSSSNPTIKKIGDEIRRHPERRMEDVFYTKDISTIVKDNAALLLIKSNAESLLEQSYEYNNHTCRVTLAKETFYRRPLTYTFPKNSPYRKSFDAKILLLYQAGLIDYAHRRSAISHKHCSVSDIQKIKSEKAFALKLMDLTGIFVMLGTGMALGMTAFIAELVVAKLIKKQRVVVV